MSSGRLRVNLFQDGAELEAMIAAKNRSLVSGFTTNPTLMRKAGIMLLRNGAALAATAVETVVGRATW